MDIFSIQLERMKPEWTRHPAWRWQQVLGFITSNDPIFLVDSYVQRMAEMYRALSYGDPATACAMVSNYLPEYQAHILNTQTSLFGGAKWQIEALIMSGCDDDELQDMLPVAGYQVYEVYRKIYFDVDSYLSDKSCVLANIFSTSYATNSIYKDCDLLWKMLAYNLGKEKFQNVLAHQGGALLEEDIQVYMHSWQQARTLYHSHHMINDMRLMHNEALTSTVLRLARSKFNMDDQQIREQEELKIQGCVKQLLGSIEHSMMPHDRLHPPVEYVKTISQTGVEKSAATA